VDGGHFPWADHPERFHVLNEPEASYYGVVYTEAMGEAAYIARARTVPLRNTGSAISPMNAYLILRGLQTLPLQMERHRDNALAVAHYLADHPRVDWVNFGDVKSLAAHPASTTHRQLSGEELNSAGITPDMIRLCIGVEDIEDIIADLEQALNASA